MRKVEEGARKGGETGHFYISQWWTVPKACGEHNEGERSNHFPTIVALHGSGFSSVHLLPTRDPDMRFNRMRALVSLISFRFDATPVMYGKSFKTRALLVLPYITCNVRFLYGLKTLLSCLPLSLICLPCVVAVEYHYRLC